MQLSRLSALDSIADQLANKGWCVSEDFVDSTSLDALSRELECLWRQGEFRAARIGAGERKHLAPSVRSDRIRWIEDDAPTACQSIYLSRLDELRLAVNRRTFLGLFEWEGHLACYPPGAHYRQHLDVFADASERKISTVLYLNPHWRTGDGGELRLWTTPGATDGPSVDIEPRFGTFVAFVAEDHFHEVLPTTRERYSVTGWFRVRPQGG